MRRTIFALCAVLLVSGAGPRLVDSASAAAKPVPKDSCSKAPSKWQHMECEEYTHSAPGDQYFGRMKLSYLGINNTFHDAAIEAGAYTTNSGIVNKIKFADEALNQWASRFPKDPQLPRSYFLAIQVYKKIYTQPAQEKAWNYMQILVKRYPTSYFGKIEKADLARGFTEHWFAMAQICPTPLPLGIPLPLATPDATPTPEVTPTPQPSEPKVQIITPSCIPPTTPSPSPSPEPSGSIAPMAVPVASPSVTPSARP
ncbi:MAG: hypothetical protein ACYDGM_07795 [Vulcanimicrobiaceae bacterium]